MAEATSKLEAQYNVWIKQFPKSAGVEYGMGAMYEEDPRSKPYLLKAVQLNPKLAPAYEALSFDAERWGDEGAARDYMGKAAAAAPDDPSYAFYYADMFEDSDPAKYVQMSLDVTKRFPESERGAQALYWLGEKSTMDADKIRYWEQARTDFPPAKFGWSADAMSGLFDVYARTDPDKALQLAQQMESISDSREKTEWTNNITLAQNLIQVRKLTASGQYADAKTLLDGSKIGRYSSDTEMFDLLKAEVTAGAGDTKGAYDALLSRFAKTPEDAVQESLLKYGATLGKSPAQVNADVWALRDTSTKPAPDFNLDQYLATGKRSLADYRGKVVLLTFWFPGCGPCRGEFPHFEKVLKKFRGKSVSYVGINVLPEQDAYVKPFMKGTRYSFTPLRADSKFAETVYHVRGEPTNFLIDQNGRIVYSNFRASDPATERELQLMIQSLLDHDTAAQ